MKRIIKLFICFLLLLPLTLFSSCEYEPIDQINYYKITVDTRNDGTLDMKFDFSWTVLDDDSQGPLEWVQIGIPNYNVDEIKALSDNIKSIEYSSDGGAYIVIYFDKLYYENQTVEFSFSTHQGNMYTFDEEFCYFEYNPGWFVEIKVTKPIVLWNSNNVVKSNATGYEGNYLKWEYSLDYGETIQVNTKYNKNNFADLKEEGQYTDDYTSPSEDLFAIILFVSIFLFVIIIALVSYFTTDPYLRNRGFVGRRVHYYHYYHHHYFSSGYDKKGVKIVNPSSGNYRGGGTGSSCACACACACAGGGRAGCSRKDFYKKVKINKVIEKLDKE